MSLRNITRGYISNNYIDHGTSGFVTVPLTFDGSTVVNATFNKQGFLWVLTLPSVMEIQTGYTMIQATLPSQFRARNASQSQKVTVMSLDSGGTNVVRYPGEILINNYTISIRTTGMIGPSATSPQGIPNATTVIYEMYI